VNEEKAKRYSPSFVNTVLTLATLSLVVYPIVSILVMEMIGRAIGLGARIVAGILLLAFFAVVLRYFGRVATWGCDRLRDEAREKHRGIYRVASLPTDETSVCKHKDTEIKIGDYGWEAKPWKNNGLIYLHGLNAQWGLVWIAGFRPEQIEYVGLKPISHYNWREFEYDGTKPRSPYHWKYAKPKNPCPFPVETNPETHCFGFPV
jgi:hypothetical protein